MTPTNTQKAVDLKAQRDALIRELKAEEKYLLELMDAADKTRPQCSAIPTDPVLRAELRLMELRAAKERIDIRI